MVERVIRAAAITPLPRAPEIVLGFLDIQGEVVPVIDVRKRFRLPGRELRPEDQFIVARARALTVALAVDSVQCVTETTDRNMISTDTVLEGVDYVAGVTRTDDGLVLIHNLDTFLSLGEEKSLVAALEQGPV